MSRLSGLATCAAFLCLSMSLSAAAQGSAETAKAPYEPELARSVGADDNGMRSYVLVVLKTGPNDGVDGWRGLFIFAVADIAEARTLVATDPVIIKGEMVAEYHPYYGSAALMLVRDAHEKIAKKR